jgi:hypothetical protein
MGALRVKNDKEFSSDDPSAAADGGRLRAFFSPAALQLRDGSVAVL